MKQRILAISLGAVMSVSVAAVFAGCSKPSKESYAVTYDLNYTDGGERTVYMPAGASAIAWKAQRKGYDLSGWFTDEACKNAYDFSQKLSQEVTLYAGWTTKLGNAVVTFDFGFASADPVELSVEKGTAIAERYIPERDRMGMTFEGWYTDEACTEEYDFTQTVAEDMTLYAGYEYDPTFVPRDENGEILYNETQVRVWIQPTFTGIVDTFTSLAEAFNAEYEGKINVEISTDLNDGGQAAYCLRVQQTPGKNQNDNTYYTVGDVYDMAGIDYSEDDWYAGAARDSYVNGKLTSVPIIAGVPYFVYNKALVEEYADGKLPQNYSGLLTVLEAAYKGESAENADFVPYKSNQGWQFQEGSSTIAFLQNGAELWTREGKSCVNDWTDDVSRANAIEGLANLYALCGANGKAHGAFDSADNTATMNAVAAGNTMFGYMTFPGNEAAVVGNDALGFVSASGLFTDHTDELSQQVPVHTIGMAFYKNASYVSNTQLAAAALFTDYVSDHAYEFSDSGWYPLSRQAAENEAFTSSENAVVQLVNAIVEPENMRSYDGLTRGKSVVNDLVSNGCILPALKGDGTDLAELIDALCVSVKGSLY